MHRRLFFLCPADANRSPSTQELRIPLAVTRLLVLALVSIALGVQAQMEQARACDEVHVFDGGKELERACVDAARARGYTVVDLADDWTPRVLSEPLDAPEALRQPYRAIYLALANERPGELPRDQAFERYLELFGIFPSFRVIRERMLDEARHQCHDAVRDEELSVLDRTLSQWHPDLPAQRERVERVQREERFLDRARERLELEHVSELESQPAYAGMLRRYRREHGIVMAIAAMQDHLRCGGHLVGRYERGVFGYSTVLALREFRREHAVVSRAVVDGETRDMLVADSRELVFRGALRALRERVADATSTIEDGSAVGQVGTVLGRVLDSPELRVAGTYGALAGGAEDLLSPMTEAAARALGWTDPQSFARFFGTRPADVTRSLRVALRLPPSPSYHASHMDLRAEIDRGDVWYARPRTANGGALNRQVERRPTLVLFARDGELWRPLARYSTTIGGWQDEQVAPGLVAPRYKESPVGPRLWRDIVAAPVWLPPPSTPDSELVEGNSQRGWRAKRELLGPGYRSAYGLAMLVHLRPRKTAIGSASESRRSDPDLFTDNVCCFDEGVRTHGSVAYDSILHGYSHGCHRLFNHLALRLMGFLLGHRDHVRHGNEPVLYDRRLTAAGNQLTLKVRSRGYRFELVPPVPMEVLPGRIRGQAKPPRHHNDATHEPLVSASHTWDANERVAAADE